MNISNSTLASIASDVQRLLNGNLQPERAGQPLTDDQIALRKIRRATSGGEGSLTGQALASIHNTHRIANERGIANGNLAEVRSNPFGRTLTNGGHWVIFNNHEERENFFIQEDRNMLENLWRQIQSSGHNLNITI